MYAGQIVEQAPVQDLFAHPKHPYTLGLFKSLPSLTGRRGRLASIHGSVPPATHFPEGCRFRTRCPFADEVPSEKEPPMFEPSPGHRVKCWLYDAEYMQSTGRPIGIPDNEEAFQ
jgi:peptide/nickel transport system ATP-binding protein